MRKHFFNSSAERASKMMTTTAQAQGDVPAKETFGFLHSIETLGTVDGPGIRYVVFLSGCSLRCKYCHNPDTSFVRRGKETTASEVVADIVRYAGFLRGSDGGVTISGGDPLFQIEFSRAILQGCKDAGLHTAIDTSGALGADADDAYLDLVDLWLLDIKSGDPATYRRTTGGELAPTLDFAERLAARGKKAWLRYVLVPALTDADENVRLVADFSARVGIFERVDVLPFHKFGAFKWKELGLKDPLANTPEPTREQVLRAQEIFRAAGFRSVY